MKRLALLALPLLAAAAAGCAAEKAEGRPWIHSVGFTGVKSVRQKDLRAKIQVESTSWLHYPKKYLDPFTIDTDRARIEAFYRTHGYFAARVTEAEVTPHQGDKEHPRSVDIKITVDEGAPIHLDGVELTGLEPLTAAGLQRDADKLQSDLKAALKDRAVLDHDRYLEQKSLIEARLQSLGYAWAKVDGSVEVNRDTQLAIIKLTATPGPRAQFGHVHVRGANRVDPKRIALHTGIGEGTRFDPDTVEDARGRVYNLGLFSSVRVEYEHSAERPDVADVIVTVQEGTFNELRLGFGIGLESQRTDAHASVIYSRRNWLGRLRTLRLRLEPAYVAIPAIWNNQRSGPAAVAEATLTQPDFPWKRGQLKWTVGYDVGIEYAYQYHGPRTQLGVTHGLWHDHIQLGFSYNFTYLKFFNTDPVILSDPAQAGRLFGYVDPYRLGWWQEDFALDLRDHPLDAHKGFYLGLSGEEGGAYAAGAFQYEKITPDVRAYLPLGRRITAAARIMFGQIITQGDLGSPITRRFYLGGPSSHRGFNYNRLSQQVPSGQAGIPPLPIGGDQMVLAQFELRLNVLQIAGQWLSFAAFFDAGDVAPPNCSLATCGRVYPRNTIDITNLHYATGGGLRYKTIIGTVRFDLGVRLNRLSEMEPDGTPNPDPGQRIAYHISVGEAF